MKPQFAMTPHEIIENLSAELGLPGIGLYTTLADYAGKKKVCWPSLHLLAKKFKVSRNTIAKYLQ